jgi:hypothetical protein
MNKGVKKLVQGILQCQRQAAMVCNWFPLNGLLQADSSKDPRFCSRRTHLSFLHLLLVSEFSVHNCNSSLNTTPLRGCREAIAAHELTNPKAAMRFSSSFELGQAGALLP